VKNSKNLKPAFGQPGELNQEGKVLGNCPKRSGENNNNKEENKKRKVGVFETGKERGALGRKGGRSKQREKGQRSGKAGKGGCERKKEGGGGPMGKSRKMQTVDEGVGLEPKWKWNGQQGWQKTIPPEEGIKKKNKMDLKRWGEKMGEKRIQNKWGPEMTFGLYRNKLQPKEIGV